MVDFPRRAGVLLALTAGLSALPGTGLLAEGAARVFDCTGAAGTTQITIAPVSLDSNGKGAIEVRHDGVTASGFAAGDTGPFNWSRGLDSFTLIIDGATPDGGLKVRLHHVFATGDAEAPFDTSLTPYTCETEF